MKILNGHILVKLRVLTPLCLSLLLSVFAVTSECAAQNRESVHSFRFHETELHVALDSLIRWYAVPLIYLENDVAEKVVTAECNECVYEEALKKVIVDQDLVARTIGGQVVLQSRQREREVSYATLAGTVTDSLTDEWVVGASVFLQSDHDSLQIVQWCPTNDFGFFSLSNITPGSYTLVIRSVGYRTSNERVTVHPNTASVNNYTLCQQNVVLQEITVEGRRSAFAASEGISRSVYIRATPMDQNQYLLEGARIYNPSHYGGVLSTFNGDALRDVQTLAGGVPPYYGGRIGGILDVTLREGSGERLAGSAGVGSIGSSLLLEGPIADQTTFVFSGRRAYPDLFMAKHTAGKARSDLRSSELMAKVSHRIGANSRLVLSGYFGHDAYGNTVRDAFTERLANDFRWGNSAVNLRWISVASPSLFLHASAVYTRYGFDVAHRLTNSAYPSSNDVFLSDYGIEDVAVRAQAEYFYNEQHTARAGVELVHHKIAGTVSEFSSQVAPSPLGGFSPWELSVYFQDQWRLLPSVSAELGARATSFIGRQGSFSSIDPRFSLLVSLDNSLRLYSSLTSVNQFIHPYRNSGIFLFYPTIFFYPSAEKVPPSTSMQVSLGMEKNFRDDRYTLALESYYRVTQKLHEFVFDTTHSKILSEMLILGEANVYGAELTLKKRTGNVTGSIRYSLSWSSNRFAELNRGESFRPRFDRRHELFLALSYSPGENWSVGTLCLLSANEFPLFGSKESNAAYSTTLGFGDPRIGPAEARYAEPIDLNGARLPGFQRLELYFAYSFSSWGLPFQVTLRMLNGYGLLDPFVWELRNSPDARQKWSATFDASNIFPLYPVVNLSVRF